MLILLYSDDKLNSFDDYDTVVKAEIPNQREEPRLFEAVLKHMIHGPCGGYHTSTPCMKQRHCKRLFPKPFANATSQGNDSYPIYRRRNTGVVPLPNCLNVVVDKWLGYPL